MGDRLGTGVADGVGHEDPSADLTVPGGDDRGVLVTGVETEFTHPGGRARHELDAIDRPAYATSGHSLKVFQAAAFGQSCGDGAPDRVFAARFQSSDQPGEVRRLGVHVGLDVPLCEGSGLVQHHGVDGLRALQDLRTRDEYAELSTPTGADQDRRGGCQSERARAGDDEHRDSGGERGRPTRAGDQPADGREHREDQHHRYEHRGHAVRKALDRSLPCLGPFHCCGDLRELSVGSDTFSPGDEPARLVDRRADQRIARADLDRHRLPGDQGIVDR